MSRYTNIDMGQPINMMKQAFMRHFQIEWEKRKEKIIKETLDKLKAELMDLAIGFSFQLEHELDHREYLDRFQISISWPGGTDAETAKAKNSAQEMGRAVLESEERQHEEESTG